MSKVRPMVLLAVAAGLVGGSLMTPHATRSQNRAIEEQPSLLSHLKPGRQVELVRYEGGLVRFIDHALPPGKRVGELPMVVRVTDGYVELKWDNEERTATQILSKQAILEIWLDNELKPVTD